MKTREQALEELRQKNQEQAEAVRAKMDQLTPGLTESEVIEILGEKTWEGFMNVGTHQGLNKMVMNLPENKYLVLEWRYEGDKASIENLPVYSEPGDNSDAALVKTLERVRISDEPL